MRGRAGRGGVNEELETAENHPSLLGLQEHHEEVVLPDITRWGHQGLARTPAGFACRGWVHKGQAVRKAYRPKDTATPRNCPLMQKNFRNTPASLLLNPSRIHQCFLQAKPIWKPKPETTYRKCGQNKKDKRVRTGSWCKQATAGTINSRRIKESRVNLSHRFILRYHKGIITWILQRPEEPKNTMELLTPKPLYAIGEYG